MWIRLIICSFDSNYLHPWIWITVIFVFLTYILIHYLFPFATAYSWWQGTIQGFPHERWDILEVRAKPNACILTITRIKTQEVREKPKACILDDTLERYGITKWLSKPICNDIWNFQRQGTTTYLHIFNALVPLPTFLYLVSATITWSSLYYATHYILKASTRRLFQSWTSCYASFWTMWTHLTPPLA